MRGGLEDLFEVRVLVGVGEYQRHLVVVHPARMAERDRYRQAMLLRRKAVLSNQNVALPVGRYEKESRDEELLLTILQGAGPPVRLAIAEQLEGGAAQLHQPGFRVARRLGREQCLGNARDRRRAQAVQLPFAHCGASNEI